MRFRLVFPFLFITLIGFIGLQTNYTLPKAEPLDISESNSEPYKPDTLKYDFIQLPLNVINDPEQLSHFFTQLKRLENNKIKQVRIAHIGDSHIQADFLPGQLRNAFQEQFGQAGRGLIFPYQQAGTHSPIDAKSNSPNKWDERRSVFKKHDLPIGISGMSIRTNNPDFKIEHYMKERFDRLETFDQVTIFHPDDSNLFDFQVSNATVGPPTVTLNQLSTQFYLSEEVSSFIISASKRNIQQKQAIIHGVLLENTNHSGVLYNMMGVNGTTFYHYNRCSFFIPQLAQLKPDLIIISLGTNEALTSNFTSSALSLEMKKLLSDIRSAIPSTSILLTTLPDSFKKKVTPNSNGPIAKGVIIEQAKALNCANWDLFEIMGGEGSMRHWVEEDLGFSDHIHFKRAGYELIGDLLYQAIMDAYSKR